MEIVRVSKREFLPSSFNHRDGGISFKILFEGSEEDRVNNYQLALVLQQDFVSPVHKHNFDQFRYGWKGNFNISPKLTIEEGEFCYHPEGVYYGPQEDDCNERILYLIQFGGASGAGYVGKDVLALANRELDKAGDFKEGKYYPYDGRNPVDGYQALWEHVHVGEKLHYPLPRYRAPILVSPKHMVWVPYNGNGEHAYRKLFGTFSERGALAQELKIDPMGFLEVAVLDAHQFLIVRTGQGDAEDEHLEAEDAIRLQPGHGLRLSSSKGIILLHYILPMIH